MVARLNRLSARGVAALTKPGRHADGGNLYLNVTKSGAKSWVFMYTLDGRQREMGLGSLQRVPLLQARKLAESYRTRLGAGEDPIAVRDKPSVPTFGTCADAYIASHAASWSNPKHVDQWRMTLSEYAGPLRSLRVDKISTADVLKVLNPIWQTKPETASRVRGRIEAVLNAATAQKHRSGENPARWVGKGEQNAETIARDCGTDARVTKQLLDCLVGLDYACWRGGKYGLPASMRKWLLRSSPSSIVNKLVYGSLEWDFVGKTGDFVRTGKPLAVHEGFSQREWAVYQDAMRDVAANPAVELAKRLLVPPGATRLLDIGGSHGLFSAELCKRHPALTATILELPGAVDRASEIAQREGLGDRVKYRVGNALTDELGEATFDVVMANNLVHNFSTGENSDLAKRVARALSRGGVYAIGDFLRPSHPGAGGGVPAVMDLFFALVNASGTWALQEMVSWQRDAGLEPMKAIKFPSLPGWASAPAAKRN